VIVVENSRGCETYPCPDCCILLVYNIHRFRTRSHRGTTLRIVGTRKVRFHTAGCIDLKFVVRNKKGRGVNDLGFNVRSLLSPRVSRHAADETHPHSFIFKINLPDHSGQSTLTSTPPYAWHCNARLVQMPVAQVNPDVFPHVWPLEIKTSAGQLA
jgi:hypothetical protein